MFRRLRWSVPIQISLLLLVLTPLVVLIAKNYPRTIACHKVEFSYTKYPEERLMVRRGYDTDSDTKGLTKDFNIAIAKYDLNNDGIMDIITYVQGDGGTAGNSTVVYIVDNRKHWQGTAYYLTDGSMAILEQKHMGYHDIALVGQEDGAHDFRGFSILSWTGKFYDGFKQIRINKKELEEFDNGLL